MLRRDLLRGMADEHAEITDLAGLSEALAEAMSECLARGMKLPLVVCAVGVNGSAQLFRFRGPGTEMEELAEHNEPNGMMLLPINIMILDSAGEATRVITAEGMTFH